MRRSVWPLRAQQTCPFPQAPAGPGAHGSPWLGPLPATSQRPLPAPAFLPAQPPHLTAKSTLLPSRGGSVASRPQGQEPNLARPQARASPVPRPSCPAPFPEHSPPLPRLQAPPSKRVTLGHSCKRKGPDCRGTPAGTPDTARGDLALLSRISGTPSHTDTPLNKQLTCPSPSLPDFAQHSLLTRLCLDGTQSLVTNKEPMSGPHLGPHSYCSGSLGSSSP